MIADIKKDSQVRMQKSVDSLKSDLAKLRTGRAHPSLLENLSVSYYGNDTPLSQVASIAASDSRTLTVTPWEKDMVAPIEKAIMTSDLGLNPASAGNVIRVPLPPLTEERRKEIVRLVKDEGEKAKIAVRNIRRDANNAVKNLEKEKTITTDQVRASENDIQKLTDKFVASIDDLLAAKESELMEV